jgi:hypothetical protein
MSFIARLFETQTTDDQQSQPSSFAQNAVALYADQIHGSRQNSTAQSMKHDQSELLDPELRRPPYLHVSQPQSFAMHQLTGDHTGYVRRRDRWHHRRHTDALA